MLTHFTLAGRASFVRSLLVVLALTPAACSGDGDGVGSDAGEGSDSDMWVTDTSRDDARPADAANPWPDGKYPGPCTDAFGETTIRFRYDDSDRIVWMTEWEEDDGVTHLRAHELSTFDGDRLARVVTVNESWSWLSVTTHEYDARGLPVALTTDRSIGSQRRTTRSYDGRGNLTEEIEREGDVEIARRTYVHDERDRVVEARESNYGVERVTIYRYEGDHLKERTERVDGTVTLHVTFVYEQGLVVEAWREEGGQDAVGLFYHYDDEGRPLSVTKRLPGQPGFVDERFVYDPAGNLVTHWTNQTDRRDFDYGCWVDGTAREAAPGPVERPASEVIHTARVPAASGTAITATAVAAADTSALLAWTVADVGENGFDPTAPVLAVMVARIALDGSLLDEAPITLTPPGACSSRVEGVSGDLRSCRGAAAMASAGDGFLVVWGDSHQVPPGIYGSRVDPERGSLDGTGVLIAEGARVAGPKVIFDGADYVILYADHAEVEATHLVRWRPGNASPGPSTRLEGPEVVRAAVYADGPVVLTDREGAFTLRPGDAHPTPLGFALPSEDLAAAGGVVMAAGSSNERILFSYARIGDDPVLLGGAGLFGEGGGDGDEVVVEHEGTNFVFVWRQGPHSVSHEPDLLYLQRFDTAGVGDFRGASPMALRGRNLALTRAGANTLLLSHTDSDGGAVNVARVRTARASN